MVQRRVGEHIAHKCAQLRERDNNETDLGEHKRDETVRTMGWLEDGIPSRPGIPRDNYIGSSKMSLPTCNIIHNATPAYVYDSSGVPFLI